MPRVSSTNLEEYEPDLFSKPDNSRKLLFLFDESLESQVIKTKEEVKNEDLENISSESHLAMLSPQDPDTLPSRHYSLAQRIYLDRLEQGDYNTYAGGLLYQPFIKRYGFHSILESQIKIKTYEGYVQGAQINSLPRAEINSTFHSQKDLSHLIPPGFYKSYPATLFGLEFLRGEAALTKKGPPYTPLPRKKS